MFNKAKWLRSGLRPDCKDCYSTWKKAYWAAQPKSDAALRQRENALLASSGRRRCKECAEVKRRSPEDFAVTASGVWQTTCRECDRARVRRWAEENGDRYKATAAASWASRHARKKRRTLRLSAEHSQQLREIYAECRKRNKHKPRAWHVDHIVPMSGKNVSGLHVPWNLRIVPAAVNTRKANKWMSEESCSSGAGTAEQRN